MTDEFHGLTADEWKTMTTKNSYACPRCEYPLVPVHAVEGTRRRVIALTCPEPYCDHMQMIPMEQGRQLESQSPDGLRAVN